MDKTYFDRETAEIRRTPFDIFVNQAGYRPDDKKTAVMAFPSLFFQAMLHITALTNFQGTMFILQISADLKKAVATA